MATAIKLKWIAEYANHANLGSDCGYVIVPQWTNGYIDPVGILSECAMKDGVVASVHIRAIFITSYGYRLRTTVNLTVAAAFGIDPDRLDAIQECAARHPVSVIMKMINDDEWLPEDAK